MWLQSSSLIVSRVSPYGILCCCFWGLGGSIHRQMIYFDYKQNPVIYHSSAMGNFGLRKSEDRVRYDSDIVLLV